MECSSQFLNLTEFMNYLLITWSYIDGIFLFVDRGDTPNWVEASNFTKEKILIG